MFRANAQSRAKQAVLIFALLLAAGFSSAGTADDNLLWDSQFAYPSGNGLDTTVSMVASGNGKLYAAGAFTTAGQTRVLAPARFNGSNWSTIGDGPGYVPRQVGAAGDYVATTDGSRVDVWDGTSWATICQSVGHTVDGRYESSSGIGTISSDGRSLYVANWFWNVFHGPFSAQLSFGNDIYRWDAQDSGLVRRATYSTGGVVCALAGDSSNTYVAGSYLDDYVFRMTKPMGQNVVGTVYALAVSGSSLYAGGSLNRAGDISVSNVVQWDGSSWSGMGTGINGTVNAMATCDKDLYVAGDFTTAGGANAGNIARWDGSSWSALGGGLNGQVCSLAICGRAVAAGGAFTAAGGRPSSHIAVWRPRVNISTGTLTANPGATTFGNDPYGFYKPALMTGSGTTVSFSGALPTTFTLDQAEVTTVGGQRLNGAFVLSPEGVRFGGDEAVLHVEFSQDDAEAFGVPYTEFRAVRLTQSGLEPEATLLSSDLPVPVRVDNGRQIYAITAPITETGGVYGAVPRALIPQYRFSLDVQPLEGGVVSVDPPGAETSYACGTVLTLTAQSASGYMLDHWSGDLAGSENPTSVEIAKDTSVTANFSLGYKLALSVVPFMGTISVDPLPDSEGKYALGTTVTLRAHPAWRLSFDGWSGALTGFANPSTITMTTDTAVEAHFALRYGVQTQSIPSSGGTITVGPAPDPDNCYRDGAVITVSAEPSPGYSLVRWGGDLSGNCADTTLTMRKWSVIYGYFGLTDAPNLTGKWDAVRTTRQTASGTLEVSNKGDRDAGTYKVRFYLSNGYPLDDDIIVKTMTVRKHGVGHTVRLQVSCKVRPGTDLSGKFLVAVIDPDSAVQEQDEWDNSVWSQQLR